MSKTLEIGSHETASLLGMAEPTLRRRLARGDLSAVYGLVPTATSPLRFKRADVLYAVEQARKPSATVIAAWASQPAAA